MLETLTENNVYLGAEVEDWQGQRGEVVRLDAAYLGIKWANGTTGQYGRSLLGNLAVFLVP
jgi:hypothetical protein